MRNSGHLRQFLSNQTYSESRPFRISVYATQIAKALGLDSESTEDLRTATLLQNLNEVGISNEILYKARISRMKTCKTACASGAKQPCRPWEAPCGARSPSWSPAAIDQKRQLYGRCAN